ncbi:MAG: ribulose 1,5-bisphosphate carboxylase [Gemmatimonadetes bacterium]|nr:ribulose 1,5-bisphosphate carboxylase [Gemmatimonadota bacterium]
MRALSACGQDSTLTPRARGRTRNAVRASPERLRITYRLTCAVGEDPDAKARDIAWEQTVELPEGSIPPDVEQRIVGEVEAIEPLGAGRWMAAITFDPVTVGADLPQLLNVLFGNISLKAGILVTGMDLPPSLLGRFPGPQLGIQGVREACGVEARRPLLSVAAKPVGLTADALADLCYRLARAGIDIVKDDHGLADQETAPFRQRVERCQQATQRANTQTGGRSLYFPNITGPAPTLEERVRFARSAGCRGVLVSPLLVGLDAVRWLAESSGLAILSHPALAGAFWHEGHGIAADVLLGTIFRLIGSDGVIYPNVGGRFPLSLETCEAINRNLRAPLGRVRPAFPVAAGGIEAARVPYWTGRYGPDTIFLVSSSLYAQPDLEGAARSLVDAVKRHGDERPIEGH